MNTSQVLYHAAGIPAMQNKFFSNRSEALAFPSASLEIVQDETGLVFNRRFDSSLVEYDDSYQNDQGYSLQFKTHLDKISDLCSRYLRNKDCLVVDVGCGKGGFVELMRGKGFNSIGYDNAYQGDSPYIRKSFFSVDSHEKGELLILRHVLEHIPSPWKFLDGIAAANNYQGLLYIEVPDLEWILENRAYFDLFHEHVNYFRIDDFVKRFGKDVVFQSKSFGGQYLSVIIRLECFQDCNLVKECDNNSDIVNAFSKLSEYESQAYNSLAEVDDIVIWGAAAKGVMFAAKAPLNIKNKIRFAIDINPSKQGYFMPISGLQVLSPKTGLLRLTPSSLVIIMNPNYEEEIQKSLPHKQPWLSLHK